MSEDTRPELWHRVADRLHGLPEETRKAATP